MDIKNSIVSILNSGGKIVGTGFLAGQNLVVTCAHVIVIAGAFYDDTVQVRFDNRKETISAVVLPECWRDVDKGDVAVLRLDKVPDGVSPLPLGSSAGSAGHDFYAYGYARVTDVQGIGARGKIVDIVDNGRLVQLTSQEPDHGMSGGPVLDEANQKIIGMITKGKGVIEENQNIRNAQTTFATSMDVIVGVCSQLRLQPVELENEEISLVHKNILTFLYENVDQFTGEMTDDDISSNLEISPKKTILYLAQLEKFGYISKRFSSLQQRVISFYSITDAGISYLGALPK